VIPKAPSPRLRVQALRSPFAGPFDLILMAGECVSITGPSGAGKSLFLRLIADLDPNEGNVWLDGQARGSFPGPAWRRQVVYGAAEPGWWDEAVERHFPGPLAEAAREMAPRLGLGADKLQGPVARLSTGERQRLALMRSLTLDPPVLLLDEPTGPLDQRSAELVEGVLKDRCASGTAMLIVTHDPGQASRLGHRHFGMAQGQLQPP
jgi:putative ABC transport system ATP-binding protein